jgi:hypothetical protein
LDGIVGFIGEGFFSFWNGEFHLILGGEELLRAMGGAGVE